ncbi:hypothetical protein NC651_007498 [Populus alba x Populus x berolinensis]|nr:hypothetical protein NC651_007498 [Populus alba x Populus x berolinensis]
MHGSNGFQASQLKKSSRDYLLLLMQLEVASSL